MNRIVLFLVSSLSLAYAIPARAEIEVKPVVEETGEKSDGEVGALTCDVVVGLEWMPNGSCRNGGTRWQQRNYAYCGDEWFEWGIFQGPTYCSNNPPQVP